MLHTWDLEVSAYCGIAQETDMQCIYFRVRCRIYNACVLDQKLIESLVVVEGGGSSGGLGTFTTTKKEAFFVVVVCNEQWPWLRAE